MSQLNVRSLLITISEEKIFTEEVRSTYLLRSKTLINDQDPSKAMLIYEAVADLDKTNFASLVKWKLCQQLVEFVMEIHSQQIFHLGAKPSNLKIKELSESNFCIKVVSEDMTRMSNARTISFAAKLNKIEEVWKTEKGDLCPYTKEIEVLLFIRSFKKFMKKLSKRNKTLPVETILRENFFENLDIMAETFKNKKSEAFERDIKNHIYLWSDAKITDFLYSSVETVNKKINFSKDFMQKMKRLENEKNELLQKFLQRQKKKIDSLSMLMREIRNFFVHDGTLIAKSQQELLLVYFVDEFLTYFNSIKEIYFSDINKYILLKNFFDKE